LSRIQYPARAAKVKTRRARIVSVLLLFSAAAGLRIALVDRQGLWADELFSLAMATGHSLEHPASDAEPAQGDFVEASRPEPPAEYRSYLEHDEPPASIRRVVRAVLLSDTSPPLYYVLLQGWTSAFGTSDRALRLFSVFWALATFPLIYLIGWRLGGFRAALSACVLFTFAPVSLYYSAEGRMYSLLWFFAVLIAWVSLRLHDHGRKPALLLLWVIAGAAGLLTHYFFAFVWAACFTWLCVYPGRCPRVWIFAGTLATGLLVLPWYLQLPTSLARWRVTGHWLDMPLSPQQALTAPFVLAWNLLSGWGVWGGINWIDRIGAGLVLLLAVMLARAGLGSFFGPSVRLLWLWLMATCVGPVVFDLWRGTFTSLIPRYALAGMPAAMLLVGVALSRVRSPLNLAFLVLLVGCWLPGIRAVFSNISRSYEPYREVAERVDAWLRPSDLVIVHSIPSGVVGIARYLESDVPVAAWVGQLGQRQVPKHMGALLRGHSRVALIKIHEVGEPAPEEDWLRVHAKPIGQLELQNARVLYFGLDEAALEAVKPAGPTRR
jgi:Dolichyl-phosphate-mannose-protein mannosyltransferase